MPSSAPSSPTSRRAITLTCIWPPSSPPAPAIAPEAVSGARALDEVRALLALERGVQITAANQISGKKLSVREAESLAKRLGASFELTAQKPRNAAAKSADVRSVEEELSDLLMAQVEVRIKKRVKRHGKVEETGELAIQFGSIDALNGLIARLRG